MPAPTAEGSVSLNERETAAIEGPLEMIERLIAYEDMSTAGKVRFTHYIALALLSANIELKEAHNCSCKSRWCKLLT